MLSICPRIFEMFTSSKFTMPSTSAASLASSSPPSPMKKTSTRLAEQQLLRDVRSRIRKRKSVTDNYIVYEAYKPQTNAGEETKITRFTTGMRIEAVDCTSCWYRAEVLNVVRDKREVLVHFVGYDTRFDQVMSFDSPLIRPAGRLEALARTLRKIDRGRDGIRKPKRGPRGTSPPWRLVGMDVEPGSKRVRKITQHYDASVTESTAEIGSFDHQSNSGVNARSTGTAMTPLEKKPISTTLAAVGPQKHKGTTYKVPKIGHKPPNGKARVPKKTPGANAVRHTKAASPQVSAPRTKGNVMQSAQLSRTPEIQSPSKALTARRRIVCTCTEARIMRLSNGSCTKCGVGSKCKSFKRLVVPPAPRAVSKVGPKAKVPIGKLCKKRKMSGQSYVPVGRSRSGPILAVMNKNSADVKVRRLSEGASSPALLSDASVAEEKVTPTRNSSLGSSEGFMFDRSFAPSKIETLTVKEIVTPAYKVVQDTVSTATTSRFNFANVALVETDESEDDDVADSLSRGDTRTPEVAMDSPAIENTDKANAPTLEDLTDAAYLLRHRTLENLERDRSYILPAEASEPHATAAMCTAPPTHRGSADTSGKTNPKNGKVRTYQQQRGSSGTCSETRWAGIATFTPRHFSL